MTHAVSVGAVDLRLLANGERRVSGVAEEDRPSSVSAGVDLRLWQEEDGSDLNETYTFEEHPAKTLVGLAAGMMHRIQSLALLAARAHAYMRAADRCVKLFTHIRGDGVLTAPLFLFPSLHLHAEVTRTVF
jgi:hypothetical protein